ncbi:RING finger and transmembrane domain-containing protein 1 [Platysternon megacephalum]|uniref:RING finger and transmembrane domain-containing protein 1 n=1 Tax=Platysternon megacephalum TaxID=55544 RepID=A0A4D9ERE2_9SAUR|nr:RING finger and transmembrane domain-containing protein 1 [Platysternon megacephalum]
MDGVDFKIAISTFGRSYPLSVQHFEFDYKNNASSPIIKELCQPAKARRTNPSSSQPISKKADKLCQIPYEGFSCFHIHSPTNSLDMATYKGPFCWYLIMLIHFSAPIQNPF